MTKADRSGRPQGHVRRIPAGVWVFSVGWIIVVATLTCLKAWALYASAFDLGYFTQALGQIAREGLSAPASMTGWAFFQDHFSPLALPLAPLAALQWGSYLLLVVQALAVGLSIPAAWRLASSLISNQRQLWLLAVGYAVAPTLLFAVWFDFHPSLLSLPFLLMLADGIERDDALKGMVGAIFASLAREDIAVLVVLICLAFWRKRAKWVVAAAAVALTAGMVGLIVTGGDGSGWFMRAGFSYADPGDPIATGLSALRYAWAGGLVLLVLVSWLLPWIGWLRLDPKPFLVGFVASLPYLFSAVLTVKVPGWHYYFYFAPLGLWAVARANREWVGAPSPVAVGSVALALAVGPFALGAIAPLTPGAPEVLAESVTHRDQIADVHEALICIPAGATQSVANPFVPFAADHSSMSVWPMPFHDLLLIEGLPPILVAPQDAVPLGLVVTDSQELDRHIMFPEFVGELPARGYQLLEESPEFADIWVNDEEIGAEINRCLLSVSAIETRINLQADGSSELRSRRVR